VVLLFFLFFSSFGLPFYNKLHKACSWGARDFTDFVRAVYLVLSLENCMVWFCVSSLCRDENGFLNFFSFFPFHLFHIKACFVLSFSRLQPFLSLSLNFFLFLLITTIRKYMRWWGPRGCFVFFFLSLNQSYLF